MQTENQKREHIAQFLPKAIERAINSYHEFSQFGPEKSDDDAIKAKSFKEHHDACKVAISHLELLIKLSEWADISEDDDIGSNLPEMLKNAKNEINNYKKD